MNEGLTGVAEIEKQVNKDAISFVVRMNCLSGNALNDQLQRGVVQVMEIIRESNPTFEILGKNVGEFRVGKVVIENPNEVYDIAKKALFVHLAATVREDTSGYVILSAYQNLERLAKDTRCRYLDQAFEQRYVDEVADLEISSLPWTTVVKVSP